MKTNTIYNENCLDTMARMPDGLIDLVVTSPPYDNLRKYNGYSFDFEAIAKELFRVVKVGGVVVWVVADATVNGSETGTSFRQALHFMSLGFNLHDTMIWVKDGGGAIGSQKGYTQNHEYMFVFSKDSPKSINLLFDKPNQSIGMRKSTGRRKPNGERKVEQPKMQKEWSKRNNWWYIHVGNSSSAKDECAKDHPAIFPEQLAKDHILSWSNEGDLVYDCFGGSGTVAKMAHLEKRNWIISEISSEYAALAAKRIDPYLRQMSLF